MWPQGDPSPEAQALRERCRDRQAFAETFFGHICTAPWSQFHLKLFARFRQDEGKRGLRYATAAPRGSAKTSIIGFLYVIHAILYRLEHYILVCSANIELAKDKVKAVRDELENNEELIRIYGPQQGEVWNQADFETLGECRVRAISPGSRVRGMWWKGHRPTFILLDDAEDPTTVQTELRRYRFEQWFFADVAKLGSPTTNIEVIGTILHKESLLAHLLANPGYVTERYQSVISFARTPEAWALWAEWRGMVLNLSHPDRLDEARAFFVAHQDAMLAGTEVLWPERESYVDLMLQRVIGGELAFATENQNNPEGDDRRIFAMDQAGYCTLGAVGLTRADGVFVRYQDMVETVGFYDPTPDKRFPTGDFAAFPVLMQDRDGYLFIVEAYCEREPSTDKQLDAIIDRICQWDVQMVGVESNNFQGLLTTGLREKLAARELTERRRIAVDLIPVSNRSHKMNRIKTLEPLIENQWLQFATTLPRAFLDQFQDFIPIDGAGHDDGPDATESAIRLLKRML